jgi:hypothetical protein
VSTIKVTGEILDDLGDWLRDGERGVMKTTIDFRVALGLYEELRRRISTNDEIDLVPIDFIEAVRRHFGLGSRTMDAMLARARFALKVWREKYGPLNPEQHEYANQLLVSAVECGIKYAPTEQAQRAMVYTWLDRIVNDERGHEGFLRRRTQGVRIDMSEFQ